MEKTQLLFSILLSLGAIQGLIYAVLLWRHKESNRAANRFLALILLFFSYRLLVELLKLFGYGHYDVFYHLFLEYNWIYGPLIYFFVKAYATPDYKFSFRKNWIHFLPVFIEFLFSNFIKTQNFFWDGTRESLTWFGYWGYVAWMHYPTQFIISAGIALFYTVKSEQLLIQTEFKTYSIIKEKLKWIKQFLRVLKVYAVLVILVVSIDFLFFDYAFNGSYHYIIFIGLAIITYGLGVVGFNKKNDEVFVYKVILDDAETIQLKEISEKLKAVMLKQQLFKLPDLSLKDLANAVDEKSYLVTRSLKFILNTKFTDFVNSYRIDELRRLLNDPKNKQFTLLALAFEVGFNSKASFNRAVKKLTGKSPSALKNDK